MVSRRQPRPAGRLKILRMTLGKTLHGRIRTCGRLKSYLDKLKFELASLPTLSPGSRAFLDLYADVLRGGLGGTFLRRKGASVG